MLTIEYVMDHDNVKVLGFQFEPIREIDTISAYLNGIAFHLYFTSVKTIQL